MQTNKQLAKAILAQNNVNPEAKPPISKTQQR
jgi:hypothetical protein